MRTIRYWTSHPNRDPATWVANLALDPARYELVFDDRTPEYLFVSEHIYSRDEMRNAFAALYAPSRVSVFYAGECVFPDMNVFDYAVTFSHGIDLGGRVMRRSCRSFYAASVFRPLHAPCAAPAEELARKKGFCNFVYSNAHAHPHRDWLFHTLSAYRQVDSLGMHLNNCGNVPSRTDADWRRLSVEQKRPYKFSIAAENAIYPGYTSEKIILSFMAHTVPIYWGDPEIALEFNERAFVNTNGLSAEELIDRVRELDTDDDKYRAMLTEPPMTAEQCAAADEQERRYREFTHAIFSVPPAEAKRAPAGTWNDLYKIWALAPVARQHDVLARCGKFSLVRDSNSRVLGPPMT